MEAPTVRIGNQTSCSVPSRVTYEFALRHGFDAFEWFSDRGPSGGWREADMDAGQRRGLRDEAGGRGVRFSVHAPHAANPVHPEGAAEIRRSIDFAGDVAAGIDHGGPLRGLAPKQGAVLLKGRDRDDRGAEAGHRVLFSSKTPLPP